MVLVDLLKDVQWASTPTPLPVWKCIMNARWTPMHTNPAQYHEPKMNCPSDACSQCRLTACEIIWYLLLQTLPSGIGGNHLALFQLSFSRLACADLPGPSSAPFCCLVLEPNSISQWCLPVKSLFTQFLSSQPVFPSSLHHPTSLSAVAFDMKH